VLQQKDCTARTDISNQRQRKLLWLAHDLGKRLLKAFDSRTGIPVSDDQLVLVALLLSVSLV
jgi:hypothetical protein